MDRPAARCLRRVGKDGWAFQAFIPPGMCGRHCAPGRSALFLRRGPGYSVSAKAVSRPEKNLPAESVMSLQDALGRALHDPRRREGLFVERFPACPKIRSAPRARTDPAHVATAKLSPKMGTLCLILGRRFLYLAVYLADRVPVWTPMSGGAVWVADAGCGPVRRPERMIFSRPRSELRVLPVRS